MAVSHESIQGTLGHISCRRPNLVLNARWNRTLPMPRLAELYSMETLTGDWPESANEVGSVGRFAQRSAIWSALSRTRCGTGLRRQTPLSQIVLHVVNHATLHRGQVMGMLRQLGVKPPATDLIFYYRDTGNSRAELGYRALTQKLQSGVDEDHVAGDAAAQIAGQEHGGIGDFGRFAIAAQGRASGHFFEHGCKDP